MHFFFLNVSFGLLGNLANTTWEHRGLGATTCGCGFAINARPARGSSAVCECVPPWLVHPFPALGFRLQAAVLIHRVGGSALRGLSLVWGVRAETSGSIEPTWGVSLGSCCLASTCAMGTIWRFSRPFGCSHDLHSTRRDFVLKHILQRWHDAIHILYPNPTSRRGGVLYHFSVPCAWDSWFTLVFVLDLHNAWPPFCGDTCYNRWDLPGPYLSNRGSGAPVTGAAGGCVRTLCGVALFALVLCCPRCSWHTIETMAQNRVPRCTIHSRGVQFEFLQGGDK